MIYYRVLPQYDQKPKNDKIKTGEIYIANELYTLSEVHKQQLNLAYMQAELISKSKIYWSFGARFKQN